MRGVAASMQHWHRSLCWILLYCLFDFYSYVFDDAAIFDTWMKSSECAAAGICGDYNPAQRPPANYENEYLYRFFKGTSWVCVTGSKRTPGNDICLSGPGSLAHGNNSITTAGLII